MVSGRVGLGTEAPPLLSSIVFLFMWFGSSSEELKSGFLFCGAFLFCFLYKYRRNNRIQNIDSTQLTGPILEFKAEDRLGE